MTATFGSPADAVIIRPGAFRACGTSVIVASPQAWPLARSACVQLIGAQSGAKISLAHGLHSSIRFPPGS